MEIQVEQATHSGICASDIPFGSIFHRKGDIMMRVKPVNYLLNSSLISDQIHKNKVFAVNMKTGNLFVISGLDEVVVAHGVLQIRKTVKGK